MEAPPPLQVPAARSVPPVGGGRPQEGAAQYGRPGTVGGLPDHDLDRPEGAEPDGASQRPRHGDGVLRPPERDGDGAGHRQVAAGSGPGSWCLVLVLIPSVRFQEGSVFQNPGGPPE